MKRLVVFDAALPGITPPPAAGIPSAETNVKTWHFAFNRLDDLPEILAATDVRGGVFAGCGHYIPEDAPRAVVEQVLTFMSS